MIESKRARFGARLGPSMKFEYRNDDHVVSGWASTWATTEPCDDDGHRVRIAPNAFDTWLADWRKQKHHVRVVVDHRPEFQVGELVDADAFSRGLWVTCHLMPDACGTEIINQLALGEPWGFSLGLHDVGSYYRGDTKMIFAAAIAEVTLTREPADAGAWITRVGSGPVGAVRDAKLAHHIKTALRRGGRR